MITSEYSQFAKNPVPQFNQLRKKLDQYGYSQPLGLDSVTLVEKLFADFLQMKEKFKIKDSGKINKINDDEKTNEFEILLHENNNLHLKIINFQEELHKCSKDYKNKMSIIDKNNKDLKLLNNQYMQKLMELEKQSTDKSNIILKMQDKYFFAAVQITGQTKCSKNQFRPPKMELNYFLTSNINNNIKSTNLFNENHDPNYINLYKLTEDNLIKLREEFKLEVEKSKNLEDFVIDLKLQIENRNEEIYRLSQSARHEIPIEENNTISFYIKKVEDLQHKIDTLLKEKLEDNNKINNLENLEFQNIEINTKLKEYEHHISQLTSKYKDEISKENDRSNFLSKEVERIKLLLFSKDQSLKEFAEYKEKNENFNKNNDIILKLQSEKKKLSGTISNLMNTERELIQEIDRLKKNNIHRKPLNTSTKLTQNLTNVYVTNLEMERDFWKNEFNELQNVSGKISHHSQVNNILTNGNYDIQNKQDVINDDIFLRLCKERDELKKSLEKYEKQSNFTQVLSRENQLDELFTLKSENAILTEQIESLHQALDEFTQSKKESLETVTQLKDDIQQHKSLTLQLRLISDQAEKSLKECQDSLLKKEHELTSSNKLLADSKLMLANLQSTKQSEVEEISRLKNVIINLDAEKDDLQLIVDEKTELIVQKLQILHAKDKELQDLKSNSTDLENIIGNLRESISDKEREILSLQRQIEQTTFNKLTASKAKDNLSKENKRLQDDLSIITNENQSLNQELVTSHQKIANISTELQACISEVKRSQEIIISKEHERCNLLEQCRSLNASVNRLESSSHHLDTELSSLKMQLVSKDGELRRMVDKYEQLNRSFKDKLSLEQTFNIQLSNQTRTIASLEEAIRNIEAENHKLKLDVSATHDLSMRLEVDKTSLQRLLMNKSMDVDKFRDQICDLQQEVEMLTLRLRNENINSSNLESLIQSSRSEEWAVQSLLREKEAELILLKENLSLNDLKLDKQNKELDEMRVKCSELQSQIEQLKRQNISEKYEKERAMQELKKYNHQLPGVNTLGSISPISLSRKILDVTTYTSNNITNPMPRQSS